MERTLVILAGGQSLRMGRDKAFLPYKNTTFLRYLVQKADPYFSRICISAGSGEHAQKISGHLGPGVLVIADHYDRIGPMGGILSVFETINARQFVLLAVDMPDADMQVLAAMWDLCEKEQNTAVMLKIPGSDFVQACAAVYTGKAYRLLKDAYESGKYGLVKAIGEERIHYTGPGELLLNCPGITEERLRHDFRNINTPQDYKAPPEILAPAGTVQAMQAAVNAGCDAVYLGGELFGARAYAGNFTRGELLETLDFCHLFGVRVYMTVNTLLKEAQMQELARYMEPYYAAGLDGVIVQDVGVIRLLRRTFPDLPLHASTQMSISSVYGARLLKDQGLKRVVPARELTLDELIAIRSQVDIEIETFVHGAMCYAYSGKCLFSSFLGGRSGNRGRCAQPCRQCYEMQPLAREYSMSMKDMCTLSVLPRLIDAGIHSFKIEGRMKNPYYVAAVADAYKTARDRYLELFFRAQKPQDVPRPEENGMGWEALPDEYKKEYLSLAGDLTERMKDIYNRGGFHTGYYFPETNPAGKARNENEKGLFMISRKRPNHIGRKVGEIGQVRGSEVQILAGQDICARDVLEILPAGVELTVPAGAGKKSALWLKGRDLNRVKAGMEVYRTRNNELLGQLEQDILQKEKKLRAKARITARIGKPLKITVTKADCREGTEISVEGQAVQTASGRPVSASDLEEKMKKTGGTHLELEVECETDPQAFVPMSQFNDLRRKALDEFKEAVSGSYRRRGLQNNHEEDR